MKSTHHESQSLRALCLAVSLWSCSDSGDADPVHDPGSRDAAAMTPEQAVASMGGQTATQAPTTQAPTTQAPSAEASGNVSPLATPTFTSIYREILVDRCSGPICHSGATGGNLVMTSQAEAYEALVSAPAEGVTLPGICEGMPANCADLGVMRVAPNDPEGSLLLDKITSLKPRCGCPMPTSPPQLSEAELEQIRAWILLGAPND